MSAKTKLILLLLAATFTQTAIAAKPRFVVAKNLTGNSLGGDLCNDVARMLRDSGYTPENICHWRFRPNGPNAQSPKWTPVDIRKHPEWVRDIAMMYTADGLTLSPKEVDARWNNAVIQKGGKKPQALKLTNLPKSAAQFISERKESSLADLQSGRYRYEEAWFDINGDEKSDHVLSRYEVNCNSSGKYENPGGPVLFVIDSNGRVNMRSRGSRSYNPFFYGGRTYLLERNFRHLKPPVSSRRTAGKREESSVIDNPSDGLLRVGSGGAARDNWKELHHPGEFSFFSLCHINYRK